MDSAIIHTLDIVSPQYLTASLKMFIFGELASVPYEVQNPNVRTRQEKFTGNSRALGLLIMSKPKSYSSRFVSKFALETCMCFL